MSANSEAQRAYEGLPTETAGVLKAFVGAAQTSLGADLRSIILFGSAAEGRLRATSDVNLVLVLRRFDRATIDPLREPLRSAHAAARVSAMFLLESELSEVAEAFAVKFGDIARRHCVLAGDDVFQGLAVSRGSQILRVRQVLLNVALRLRERYAMTSLREEQLALVIAESAGPLRSAAATLLDLLGTPRPSPREALTHLARDLGGRWDEALVHMSRARETSTLPPGVAAPTLLALIGLAEALRARARDLA
jgi:predicted nucleotidyltransferase